MPDAEPTETPAGVRPRGDRRPAPSRVREVLAEAVEALGGQERPGQVQMAEEVARSFGDGWHLLVQAGTGTGKSLAYLVPALLHDKRVVIATAGQAAVASAAAAGAAAVVGRAIVRAAARRPARRPAAAPGRLRRAASVVWLVVAWTASTSRSVLAMVVSSLR